MDNTHDTICDEVFRRHPEVADCEAHRALLAEAADDGVNYSVDAWEKILGQLVADGSILARRTEEMERLAEARRQEAELEASKAERKRRMDYNDDIRKLRGMSREDLEHELRRRRQQEAAGEREANPLLQKSVEELKAIIKEQEASKKRRPGIEPLPLKIRLRYQPNVEVVLDARGIKSLDSDELRYLGQRFGFDQLNERIALTTAKENV